MIIYEVSIMMEPEIETEYRKWLEQHIVEIIGLEGFLGATLHTMLGQAKPALVISYQVIDSPALDRYLNTHAARFRKDAQDKFGNKFVAGRRILKIEKQFPIERN